jgi:surface protein
MFANCTALSTLRLGGGFDTSSVTNMDGMFDGCVNLRYLYLSSYFFKMPLTSVDLSAVSQWTESSLIHSLVDYSYDRATNGLPTLEVKLHSTVYAYLTDEHKATLTSKGYVITPVSQDPDNEE